MPSPLEPPSTVLPGLAPGDTATIAAQLLAPPDAASYALRFDLVRRGVPWFSERGVEPSNVAVSVHQRYAASYAPEFGTHVIVGGTSIVVTVALTNTGTRSWLATELQPVHLAYHWLRPEGSVVVWDGLGAPPFVNDVAPGQRVTTRLAVGPPSTKGPYILRLDLAQEGVAWLSAQGIAAFAVGFVID